MPPPCSSALEQNLKFLPAPPASLLLCSWPLNAPEEPRISLQGSILQVQHLHLSHIPDIISLVIITRGVKTDKQAAFLRRAQWESCLITLHASDEDNAAAARTLHAFYWRRRRSHPKPNTVINTSSCSSVVMLTAFIYVCVCVCAIYPYSVPPDL